MAIRFAESGGQYHFTGGGSTPGVWASNTYALTNSAPAYNGNTYAYNGSFSSGARTNTYSPGYAGLAAGCRVYFGAVLAATPIIAFYDASGNPQCELRSNGIGQIIFTKNGAQIGITNSTVALTSNVWSYLEFFAIFSTSGSGTCTAYLNGVNVFSLTSITNATTTSLGGAVAFSGLPGNVTTYMTDFYLLDTSGGPFSITSSTLSGGSTTYNGTITGGAANAYAGNFFTGSGFAQGSNNATLKCTASTATTLVLTGGATDTTGTLTPAGNISVLGDITVGEIYPTSAGSHAAWAANVGPFSITSVAVTTGVYTASGGITGGTANAYQGYFFTTSGFAQGGNNGTFLCTASSATTLTLANVTLSDTTGSAAFQNPLQIGIEGGLNIKGITNNGTRPNADVVYLSDSTTNDISDFGHQSLTLSGNLYGIIHVSSARKDDAGTRQVAQVCISGGTTELSPNISLNSTYQYYQDIIEMNPNTGTAWTATTFNAATFGMKEIT